MFNNLQPFINPIYTTRPLFPPLDEFIERLQSIWHSRHITNSGEQVKTLESEIKKYLDVPNVSLFNNGTLALMTAIKALDLTGEVITTPFTFAATPHALSWCGLTPIFTDIDPTTLTLDPQAVERAITPNTSAILGVHVYGIPCYVEELQKIADKFGLKLIYDAAHAFGTSLQGKTIGNFGDISMFSFHATKLFHTAEGGALSINDLSLKRKIDQMSNFGFDDKNQILSLGLNAKMNELQAALGLVVLNHIDMERKKRHQIIMRYHERLNNIEGLSFIKPYSELVSSYLYCPIRINANLFGKSRDELCDHLNRYNVIARRYFYPLCSEFPHYSSLQSSKVENLQIAHLASREIMCLPLYGDLSLEDIDKICSLIINK